jgi:hypothetical protein
VTAAGEISPRQISLLGKSQAEADGILPGTSGVHRTAPLFSFWGLFEKSKPPSFYPEAIIFCVENPRNTQVLA